MHAVPIIGMAMRVASAWNHRGWQPESPSSVLARVLSASNGPAPRPCAASRLPISGMTDNSQGGRLILPAGTIVSLVKLSWCTSSFVLFMFLLVRCRYPTNGKLLRIYGRFLEYVRNDPWSEWAVALLLGLQWA